MSNHPPLNPDGIEAGAKALYDHFKSQAADNGETWQEWEELDGLGREVARDDTEAAVSAYLAVAQPEVNSVEELDQLPVGTVVLDRFDYPHLKAMIALPEYLNLRTGARITRTEFYLPARVLYRPEVNDGR